MASAEEEDSKLLKFYLYARDVRNQSYFCLELHIDKADESMMLATKSKDEKSAALLNAYIQ
jgi:hypothetical protein